MEVTPFWARESQPACLFNPEGRKNARTTRGRARSGGFPVANNVVVKPMGTAQAAPEPQEVGSFWHAPGPSLPREEWRSG